jgi:uncharacterized membrane protein
MDPAEYLAIVPLLIYGIGITDLLGQWKRFFNREDRYPLYILYTIMLTEIAVYNVVIYIDLVNVLPQQSYFTYLMNLLPPILFLMVVNIFTPDEGSGTEEYFKANIRLMFVLITIFVASHFLYDFDEQSGQGYLRIIFIALLTAIAIFKKQWLMYLVAVLWLVSLVNKGGMLVS